MRGKRIIITTAILFLLSILCGAVLLYILGVVWFADARNRQLKSLFVLGIAVVCWLFLNAASMVVQPQYFVFVYTLNMISVCCVPFATLWFCLNFTGSALIQRKALLCGFITLAGLDCLALVTNPLHHLFYVSYAYPLGQFGPLFWVHSGISYVCFGFAFLVLIRHTFNHIRRQPKLLVMVLLLLIPMVFNILFNLQVLPIPHDLTPLGFFLTFLLVVVTFYRSQLFNLRTIAITSVFNSMQNSILLTNKNDIIVEKNDTFYTDFPMFSPNLGQAPVREFFQYLKNHADPETSMVLDEMNNTAFAGGEFTCRLQEQEKTYTINRRALYKNNEPTGYIITLADVSTYRGMILEINQQNQRLTELKELAESASEAKSNFLANMSHEMRTPLNAIIGMARIAKETDDPARKNYSIDKVQEASLHLLGVINDVLDMSKIEAGKFQLAPRDFDLDKMLTQTVSMMNYSIQQKQQDFRVSVGKDVPNRLTADDQCLSQVLANLLSNAVKFTPQGGRISLTISLLDLKESGCTLQFKIADNGIGISPEQQQKLFQSFEQVDSGISRKYGGTGLGLAISRNIVSMMGGTIVLESEKDKGSTFTFTINANIAESPAKTLEPTDISDDERDDFTGRRILLAEDIAINREIVMALLEPTGAKIDCAENGVEAVKMFAAFPQYDIVFMDIHMPEKDGYEATRELRTLALETAKTVPIVAMTANVFREDVEKCLAAGMNDHIGKPLNLDELMEKLRRHIKK